VKQSVVVRIAFAAALLLTLAVLNPVAHAQNIVVPASSVPGAGDAGVRAHTNIVVNNPSIMTQPGVTWETPASIACVYEVVAQVSGCPISGTTNIPAGGNGAIALVDAYDYPTAASDLQVFINQFHLAPVNFTVVYATGTKPAQDPTGGWELEEALDIEWAHAMAPNAKIYLVEAASTSLSDLFNAERVASSLVAAAGGGEVSNSWATGDFSGETSDDKYFTTTGVAYFASSGDSAFSVNYPAVSPNVVAAGGTMLTRNTSGDFLYESYWDGCGGGGGGGGLSAFEGIPAYQGVIQSIVGTHRGVPDVSSDAGPCSGVAIYDTTPFEGTVLGWVQVGGTSVSSPTLAGRANAVGSFSSSSVLLGEVYGEYGTPTIYAENFRDITLGNSNCKVGWDICSGIGSPLGNQWIASDFVLTGSMTTPRSEHAAALLNNGMALILGGYDSESGSFLSSAELYNPSAGTFAATGSLNTARYLPTATLLSSGNVLVAGGQDGSTILSSAELYDPTSGTFAFTGSMNTARDFFTATLLNNGMVLVAGGYSNGWVSSAELYNPSTGAFTNTGSMHKARGLSTATLLGNGMVLVAGGLNGNGTVISSAELYNPSTGTFTVTGSLHTARSSPTATLLDNGSVLVAGGAGQATELSSAELYNPSTGTFTVTGNLNAARENGTATLLNTGMVLVAGGRNSSSLALSSAEIYNPSTGAFAATGPMNTARFYHTATSLNNGMVLIAGGVDQNSNSLASAELFQ
jgi:Galactose oxidase, central domain/Kelch motif